MFKGDRACDRPALLDVLHLAFQELVVRKRTSLQLVFCVWIVVLESRDGEDEIHRAHVFVDFIVGQVGGVLPEGNDRCCPVLISFLAHRDDLVVRELDLHFRGGENPILER